MEPVERLASYLAGELGADEHAAVEAELARDPALRAQLGALQRADTALSGLVSPQPPPGFEERLDAAVAAALAETVHGPHAAAATPVTGSGVPWTGDELAARRARTRTWSWKPAFAGAAAAVVLLAAGVAISGIGRDDADDGVGQVAMDAPAGEMPDMGMDAAEEAVEDGPLVVVSDRDVDEDDVDALLSGPDVAGVTNRRLDDVEGVRTAVGWQAALGSTTLLEDEPVELDDADTADAGTADAAEPEDAPVDDSTAMAVPPTQRRLADERVLTPDDDLALTRCLDELLDAEGRAIPAYVEFVVYEGEEALVFGLVTLDPATDAYTRAEAWVVRRSDCATLRFSQGG